MGPITGSGNCDNLKQYYALDMPNGMTYIGWMAGNDINNNLEDVVVTETIYHSTQEDKSILNALTDVKRSYRNIYRNCYEKLPPEAFTYISLGNGNDWGQTVCRWNLGCNILDSKD